MSPKAVKDDVRLAEYVHLVEDEDEDNGWDPELLELIRRKGNNEECKGRDWGWDDMRNCNSCRKVFCPIHTKNCWCNHTPGYEDFVYCEDCSHSYEAYLCNHH